MKLQSINLARSIWLFPVMFLNPKGKNIYPIIPWLVDLYRFKTIPSQTEIPDFTKGVKFGEGEFINSAGDSIIFNFEAYNDGLIVDSRSSTIDNDVFLNEMLNNLSEIFELPNYKGILRKKAYISQVYVSTEKHLEILNPKLKELSGYLTSNIENHSYEVGGISFWADQTLAINLPPFTFERVANIPFSEKRYYSSCGLQTDNHLELLNKLEDILNA